MKVLIINASYPPNLAAGAERVVQSLAEALVAIGHHTVIVTTQPHGPAQTRTVNGVKVHYIPVRNVYHPFTGRHHLAIHRAIWHAVDRHNPMMSALVGAVLDAESPDVVNTHNLAGFSAAILGAVRERNIPLVHTMHDQYFLCPKSTMFKNGKNCLRRCIACRLLTGSRCRESRNVDIAVGVSQFILKRHTENGFFTGVRTRVIYNSVDQVADSGAVRIRRECEKLRFGFLGQLRPTKGLHNLIEAFVAECADEAELWIAGRGELEYEANLRTLTDGVKAVRWMGFVPPRELLGMVDVLVVPSLWHDTAPLVVLEAFAYGVPVLAAKRGGIPEFISVATGWLYDPDDPLGLRKALRTCIASGDRITAMSRAAQRKSEDFGLQKFTAEYLECFRWAITLRRPASEHVWIP